MKKWTRFNYLPGLPLGEDGRRVTASDKHIELSKNAAKEGMVLLKNENDVLPLKKGTKVALFGKGTFDYVKGGGGSGDVTVSYIHNIYDGMKLLGDRVSVFEELADFYRDNVNKQYADGLQPGMTREPEVPSDLLKKAANFTDTAIISISRFSGEGWDRNTVIDPNNKNIWPDELKFAELSKSIFERGDFYLTNAETAMVKAVTENFDKVIVVMNVGGMVDSCWFKENDKIQSVLMAWQGGMEGGLATAELLFGLGNPSGKLNDTYAKSLDDYPSTYNFHESFDHVDYTDDIYVGYRYFLTIPGADEKVNYPFGFGLSYTDFEYTVCLCDECDDDIIFHVDVTNIGNYAGKEVIQAYYGAPQGKLGKPKRVLGAFKKTKLLAPGETQRLVLSIPKNQMASYDDLGKVAKSAYVLEAGDYEFYLGTSSADAFQVEYVFNVEKDTVVEQLSEKLAPRALEKRMLSDGSFETLPKKAPFDRNNVLNDMTSSETEGLSPSRRAIVSKKLWGVPETTKKLIDVYEGTVLLDDFLAQLSDEDVAYLLGGTPNNGVSNTFGFGGQPDYGIPNVLTADGPAGLRIQPEVGVTTTAWPIASLLACTWDPEIVEAVGAAGSAEVKENNIGVWLTPAINIHRSPLCGRNFEYYSEDPYLAGKLASAMIRGIQSNHIGVSMKHFAFNDKETNRKNSDSRVSERAAREIYLKAFEICVKEADPWTIMSSYNLVNGERCSECRELLEDILRDEWGFKGMVTTDWWTCGEHYLETSAGNDIKMGCGYPERLLEALEKGAITRKQMDVCAKRILEFILKVD
ncbi:MAG: glycoside hydrolase family 3 C-terminal domain-containing protein [Lachnospiraceae bacterium]|nr:glycoside hydrolase family 3 C-terminal domain-containing protein [Lachnospiraceae bacterium]